MTLAGFVTPREISLAELSATPTTTPAVGIPNGVFVSTIVAQDNVARLMPVIGRWTFDLTTGDVTLNGTRVITRIPYQRAGQIILVDEYGSYACEPAGQEGVYAWASGGNALTLTKVSDPRVARSQLLTAHPWVKQ